jgi:malate/lactate dehydrogenase
MSFVAIVGSGALGGAIAHTLALRDRIRAIRLIDPDGAIARGKALDMLQSAPVESFSTRITAAESIDAAAGAAVIVLADAAAGTGEHTGEEGLALLRRMVGAGVRAPFVLAGAQGRELIARGVTELRVPPARIIGSAPLALESALRALAGIAGLSARIPGLWPPGPYALGAACARIVEALANGTRRRFTCFVAMDAGPVRAAVIAMPVELEIGGVRRIREPALTRQERTMLENALEK